jgi:hypothetical protein
MNWWDLPGPSRFVAAVADDLRDGSNVLLCCPAHTPVGLRQSILREFGKAEFHLVRPGFDNPIDLLFRRFVPDAKASVLRDTISFVERLDRRSRIVWVESVSSDVWPTWDSFLREYQHACGEVPVLGRTLFCVLPSPTAVPMVGSNEVRLGVHKYDGCANALDALLYASLTFSQEHLNSIERDISVSVIAGIALWDPHVTERLVVEPLRVILDPSSVLRDIAQERGWEGAPSWASGSFAKFGDTELAHSAALEPESPEITRRIWSAEVGVVLPRIEELRQQFLARYYTSFQMPYRTRLRQMITDVRDLEIGHICDQLQTINAPSEDRFAVEQLTKMRNQLAHLEPLEEWLLQGFRSSCARHKCQAGAA